MNENPQPGQVPQPAQPRQVVRVAIPAVKPYVTYALLAFTIFIFLLQLASQYYFRPLDPVTFLGVKYNIYIRMGQLWRLITPVFLHGSILHLGFNMYVLFTRGKEVEKLFGHWRYFLLYFLSAFTGNVFSFLLNSHDSLGSSTAIFGLLAAEGIFIIHNRKLLGERADAALTNVVSMAGINLVMGFFVPNVDNWGHLGGLAGGLLFTWFGGPRWKVEGIFPSLRLVDEREGHGTLAGTIAVLLIFIPLTALGWIWPVR